ncbi:MAG TPA: hypothetical protein VJ553_05315 [Candidatus Paceibacterota bacterium]|nr:hypothetical protein [Candidatus Paceibacterota bacterium]
MASAKPVNRKRLGIIIMVSVGRDGSANLTRLSLDSPSPNLSEEGIMCPDLKGMLLIIKTHPLLDMLFVPSVIEFRFLTLFKRSHRADPFRRRAGGTITR